MDIDITKCLPRTEPPQEPVRGLEFIITEASFSQNRGDLPLWRLELRATDVYPEVTIIIDGQKYMVDDGELKLSLRLAPGETA